MELRQLEQVQNWQTFQTQMPSHKFRMPATATMREKTIVDSLTLRGEIYLFTQKLSFSIASRTEHTWLLVLKMINLEFTSEKPQVNRQPLLTTQIDATVQLVHLSLTGYSVGQILSYYLTKHSVTMCAKYVCHKLC